MRPISTTQVLDPNKPYPQYAKNRRGEEVTIIKDIGLFRGHFVFIGYLFDEDGDLLVRTWDTYGNFISCSGSAYNDDEALVCPDEHVARLYGRLTSEDQQLLREVVRIYNSKKIQGIKAIRSITGWGLYDAKTAFETFIPNLR